MSVGCGSCHDWELPARACILEHASTHTRMYVHRIHMWVRVWGIETGGQQSPR
jgi:hypothetical protein